jgi:hypothetical protein
MIKQIYSLSPEMRVGVVAELDAEVVISRNKGLTGDRSGNGAGKVSTGGVVSGESSGNERLADTVEAEQVRQVSSSS